MIYIILALGLGIFLCLVQICRLLLRIDARLGIGNVAASQTRDEIKELRLTSRARISQASYGAAPNDSGPAIVRTGRTARSKRVVAGGDINSEQHRHLTEQLGADNEPDVSGQ